MPATVVQGEFVVLSPRPRTRTRRSRARPNIALGCATPLHAGGSNATLPPRRGGIHIRSSPQFREEPLFFRMSPSHRENHDRFAGLRRTGGLAGAAAVALLGVDLHLQRVRFLGEDVADRAVRTPTGARRAFAVLAQKADIPIHSRQSDPDSRLVPNRQRPDRAAGTDLAASRAILAAVAAAKTQDRRQQARQAVPSHVVLDHAGRADPHAVAASRAQTEKLRPRASVRRTKRRGVVPLSETQNRRRPCAGGRPQNDPPGKAGFLAPIAFANEERTNRCETRVQQVLKRTERT